MDRDEILANHQDDEDLDSSNYDFSEEKLRYIKLGMVVMVGSLLVTNFLTYRAHLLTIQAFKWIKMQNLNGEGYGYRPKLQCLDILFIFSRSHKLRYDEYIQYVNKYTDVYKRRALIWQICSIGSILAFDFIQPWEIEEFGIPRSYYVLIIAMDFPRYVLFIVKVALFPIVFAIHRLLMCLNPTCCGRKQFPMPYTTS